MGTWEKMEYLKVKGAEICYQVVGESSRWITLINGHTRGKSDFKFLAKKLTDLGFKVLTFDNRGSGETIVRAPFSFVDLCQDVVDLWLHLGVERSSLLGISMGGFIAQGLVLSTNQVDKLILVSTAAKKAAVRSGLSWSKDKATVEQRLLQNFSAEYIEKNPAVIKSMLNAISHQIHTGSFLEMARLQDEATSAFDLTKSQKVCSLPTLILHGEDDMVIPLHSAQEMAAHYSNHLMKVFPRCGHLILAEKPANLFRELQDFLLQS